MQNIKLVAGEDAVLLLHGLAGSPLELRYVARQLHSYGFAVHVPHFPGYGHGKRATDWRRWHDDVCERLERLKRDYRTVSLGGLCIGATLALSVAAEMGDAITALALLSTTLRYDGWSIPWYRFLLPLSYHTPLRWSYSYAEREPYGLKNEILRARVAMAAKLHPCTDVGASSIPLNHVYQATRMIRRVRRALPQVTAPALVVHAVDDDIASVRSADFVIDHIGSRHVRKLYLGNSYHIVTMDNEREIVAREMADFISSRIDIAFQSNTTFVRPRQRV